MRALAKTLLFVLAFLLAAAAHAAAQTTTTVILVRHAEKVDDSTDPVLSDAGRARAAALAELLAGRNVTAIYTTQYQRTRLTAAPLAGKLHIIPVALDARVPHDSVAARVKSHAGQTVLIVGHSNTVPALIRALGGPDIGGIPDAEYDNLFVIRLSGGSVAFERSRF